jgi:hypothetical protein
MPQPTTQVQADRCRTTCEGRWGEAECSGSLQQCGFPYNTKTGEYAGMDGYVGCVADSLQASGHGSAGAAIREAAQNCAPR